ncbi:MAG: hypothetical protein KGN35_00070, partial [Betaproteobacteria bacterium]|nr:hypothetical protein [Betaproteobacteria bacterium]
MAISSTEKTEILEIVVGLFNAAPGGNYMTDLANAISPPSGMTTSDLADFLANHDLFTHGVMSGKVTVDQQVNVLMNNFGVVADSDPASAGSQAKAYFTQQIENNVGFGKIVFDAVTFLSNTTDIAFAAPKTLLENKAKVAAAYSDQASSTDLSVLQKVLSNVTGTAPYTDDDVKKILEGKVPPSGDEVFNLTSGTDVATANEFKADLVFNPGGTARVNSLQNEDVLTGTGSNPTLNATLGTANDNGDAIVNPILHNIATINTDFSSSGGGGAQTAGVNTLDLRTSDPTLTDLNITRIGSVNSGNYINIPNAAAHLGVSNNSVNTATANFNYQNSVLAGSNDSGDLTLNSVNMGGAGG